MRTTAMHLLAVPGGCGSGAQKHEMETKTCLCRTTTVHRAADAAVPLLRGLMLRIARVGEIATPSG